MKKTIVWALCAVLLLIAGPGYASLNDFMADVNVRARADLRDFSVRLSSHFGVPVPDVNVLLGKVSAPADAFMCLQLSRMSRQPVSQVMQRYYYRHNKGWGQLAQELGIKPGSAEFKQLKQGDYTLYGAGVGKGVSQGKSNSNSNGKGQGKNKGNKKNK
ncbi:MAG: hypothetical protein C0620_12630 [Desulfuromonas sp.]|nr:MAG: hypothetical protein C0620_12630 [Desulfuromonas sp.]